MKITTLFCFLLLTTFFFAQQPSDTEIVTGFDGTFQIEIHNVRYQPNIPGNIMEIVSTHRQDDQIVYYPLDENIRIKIIPRNELLAPNFQRLGLIKYY
jgi:hypothetical protein